ncbi:MAG: right-handed parallel beta-helix repeat-containing protein [Alphaproteobacteria bacterium]
MTIQGSRIYDNHRTRPLNSHAEIKGSGADEPNRPAHIAILDNEIFHTSHPPGGNFQGVDCNRCDDFVIRGNHIHSINTPTEQPASYYDRGSCIQMKSLSRRTIIERNRIENCHIGIVYGGEGMETPEHEGGVVRNNLIIGNHDIGIVLADVAGGLVLHNTLMRNGRSILLGKHRSRQAARNEALIANNLMDQPIEQANHGGTTTMGNLVIDPNDADSWFVNPADHDFRLTGRAPGVIDRAAPILHRLTVDHDGTKRPQGGAPDIGAFEYMPAVD